MLHIMIVHAAHLAKEADKMLKQFLNSRLLWLQNTTYTALDLQHRWQENPSRRLKKVQRVKRGRSLKSHKKLKDVGKSCPFTTPWTGCIPLRLWRSHPSRSSWLQEREQPCSRLCHESSHWRSGRGLGSEGETAWRKKTGKKWFTNHDITII